MAWNKKIHGVLNQIGFEKCTSEHGVYIRGETTAYLIILCLYVDDLLITGSNMLEINKVKQLLMKQFEMTDMGQLSYFLGIDFKETEAGVVMHQSKYAVDLLVKFHMSNCNLVATPDETGLMMSLNDEGELADATLYRQIVGSLRYLCNTRPDIAYSVGIISRFMKAPKISHMMATKKILRYVKGTTDYGVLLPFGQNESNQNMLGYTDSDWRKDKNDRKSTAAYVFMYSRALIS